MIFELAYNLRMPVYKLFSEIPYDEYIGWIKYFEKRPIGWREDDRTYKLLQTQGVKEKAGSIFPTLNAIYTSSSETSTEGEDPLNIKGSFLFHKMLGAKGGDKLDL